MNVIYPLADKDRGEIIEHLLSLSAGDRRLRFGTPASDSAVAHYVEGIAFGHDAVFGVRDANQTLVGITHVAQTAGIAELGLSVNEAARGRGLAQSMFRRAALHARNRGIRELYMHCLAENAVMMHVARKSGMRIVIDGPERDAWLALPGATPLSIGEELQAGQLVLLDSALRAIVDSLRETGRLAAARPVPPSAIRTASAAARSSVRGRVFQPFPALTQ